ncbi:putative Dynein intermediate chain 2; axonemal [Paratrimastix pyriformis]|uniref:Dynein intermediate chain 2 n=1 Tax=Paratrimastix pyriformis TaxID=342808 RepID=A0ABQ8UPV8_9EUKA|nr:putative Dynein intermediate chain 2; axonemal [Paratrimastix pyriformis]
MQAAAHRTSLIITRKRSDFGQDFSFLDKDAHQDFFEYIHFPDSNDAKMMLLDWSCSMPKMVDSPTQTPWNPKRNYAVQVEHQDIPEAQKDTLLRTPEMKQFTETVERRVGPILLQNISSDVFIDDFRGLSEEETGFGNKSERGLKTLTSYDNFLYTKNKLISCIDWQPGSRTFLAAACVERCTFEERVEMGGKYIPSYILVWAPPDPLPQFVLEAPSDVTVFRYCPTTGVRPGAQGDSIMVVVGGCLNGQIVVWDIGPMMDKLRMQSSKRQGGKEKEAQAAGVGVGGGAKEGQEDDESKKTIPVLQTIKYSLIDEGHSREVTDLRWIDAYKGALPKMREDKPKRPPPSGPNAAQLLQEQEKMDREAKLRESHLHPTKTVALYKDGLWKTVALDKDGLWKVCATRVCPLAPTEAAVCSEDGEVVLRGPVIPAPKEEASDSKPLYANPTSLLHAHQGVCTVLERSPFVPSLFLTAGGWTFSIWRGIPHPVIHSPNLPCPIRAACWSPTRPSVFVLARADGWLEVWSLLDRTHEPSAKQPLTNCALTSLSFSPTVSVGPTERVPQYLAVGDEAGQLHLVEVPRNLAGRSSHQAHERELFEGLLEREARRIAESMTSAADRKKAAGVATTPGGPLSTRIPAPAGTPPRMVAGAPGLARTLVAPPPPPAARTVRR